MESRQRTEPVICSIKRVLISSGAVIAVAVTLQTSGMFGVVMVISARASAIFSAAGCINGQWNGADTGKINARFAPACLAKSTARSTADL